jgi:hypothetical protein
LIIIPETSTLRADKLSWQINNQIAHKFDKKLLDMDDEVIKRDIILIDKEIIQNSKKILPPPVTIHPSFHVIALNAFINSLKKIIMKPKLTALALVLFLSVFSMMACGFEGGDVRGNRDMVKKQHTVGDFNRLHISGVFKVYLVEGQSGQIEVETDQNIQEYVKVEVKNNVLTLSLEPHFRLDPTRLEVYITTNHLNEIRMSGASSLQSRHALSSDNLNIGISGACDLNLMVRTGSLKTDVSGAGSVKIAGEARNHDIHISGVAAVNCLDLNTSATDVSISGAGSAKVNAADRLKASVSGVGSVQYKGNPADKRISSSGAGRISPI